MLASLQRNVGLWLREKTGLTAAGRHLRMYRGRRRVNGRYIFMC